ncbi:FUSC family protein, partial [Arcanobacterium phocae]|uniref:FUSC family protein n=1 Tax=Arcanobacterium phocae TaxID=131112 RepID=UPI001C1288B3
LIFDIHHPVHRRATRTAIAILLAMALVYVLKKPSHGEWIILSAFIVSQDTIGTSLWKAEGRFWGALFGAIASLAIYALIRQHHALIFFTAFLTIFPYVYLLSALDNYGYAYFFLQVAYVCFLAAVGKPLLVDLIEWRAIEIGLGCMVGIVVALFVLPTSDRPRLQKGQLTAWNEMRVWFTDIVAAYRSEN